jgi:hypothetical protein
MQRVDTPNLFRNAIDIDDLRRHASFIALPPVEHMHILSPSTFRCVPAARARALPPPVSSSFFV